MKRAVIVAILVLTVIPFFSQMALSAEPDFAAKVKKFIKTVESNDRNAIANLVNYPLHREVPLSSIDTPTQFLERFDEVLDE